MCQAIVKPAGLSIAKSVLQCAWNANSDGAGFAVRHEGKVEIHKGYTKFKAFWKAYRHYEELDCLIHFRYATHGGIDIDNCHPFPIGQEAAMIHNGILSRFLPSQHEKRSDTRLLIEDFIVPSWKASGKSVHSYLTSPEIVSLIEKLIGHNKLAALTPHGFIILNEILGEWSEGVWYSAGVPMEEVRYSYGKALSSTIGYKYDDDRGWYEALYDSIEDDHLDEEETTEDLASCAMCDTKGVPLCYVGHDTLCESCWDTYAVPANPLIR